MCCKGSAGMPNNYSISEQTIISITWHTKSGIHFNAKDL